MTGPDARRGPAPAARRLLTNPVAPLVVLALAGVGSGIAGWAEATWAVLGGLAGYTLSGSV